MVFQTVALFVRSKGPDEFWRKRKIFKLAAHFRGRARNCYSNAIRAVHRALQYSTIGRRLKKQDLKELWDTRIEAAAEEQKIPAWKLRDNLAKNEILLSRKCLSDVAVWEPRTFRALASIAPTTLNHNNTSDETKPKQIFMKGAYIN